MKKEFVPYEQTLALKELGFNEPCFGWFTDEFLRIGSVEHKHVQGVNEFLAPTYSQAFRWFRDKHNICGWVQESYFKGLKFYQYHISRVETLNIISDLSECTYEEAELCCLRKLIEIVKKDNG